MRNSMLSERWILFYFDLYSSWKRTRNNINFSYWIQFRCLHYERIIFFSFLSYPLVNIRLLHFNGKSSQKRIKFKNKYSIKFSDIAIVDLRSDQPTIAQMCAYDSMMAQRMDSKKKKHR